MQLPPEEEAVILDYTNPVHLLVLKMQHLK